MRLPSICRHPFLWLAAFLGWAAVLWVLSDGPIPVREGPEIPGLDKILHFGYFFGGAGLLSAALFLLHRSEPNWPALMVLVVIVLAGVGLLDEWHQSWIPERSGNDPGDWLADVYGSLAGTLVFRRVHGVLT